MVLIIVCAQHNTGTGGVGIGIYIGKANSYTYCTTPVTSGRSVHLGTVVCPSLSNVCKTDCYCTTKILRLWLTFSLYAIAVCFTNVR